MTSIADIKQADIETWLNERALATERHANNYLFITYLEEDLVHVDEYSDIQSRLLVDIENTLYNYQDDFLYKSFTLVDASGEIVLSTEYNMVGRKITSPYVTAPLTNDTAYIDDIQLSPDGVYVMRFSSPVYSSTYIGEAATQPPIGVVVVELNMENTLYPIIRSWPGMGETGETLLARREGDEVVFINQLRHVPNAPLTLKISADSDWALPAFQATAGDEDIIKSVDYRGVPIIAAYRYIPETGWGFVAKMDQSEAFAPVSMLLRNITVISSGLLLFAIVLAFYASNRFTSRIITIERQTRKIAHGSFEKILVNGNHDEITSLALSLNQMTDQLEQTLNEEKKLSESLAEAKVQHEFLIKLSALYEHALELNEYTRIDDIISSTLRILDRLTAYDHYTFLVLDDEYRTEATYTDDKLSLNELNLNDKSYAARAAYENRSILVNDTTKESVYPTRFPDTLSELCVPIFVNGKVFGVLDIESIQVNEFTEQDKRLVELLVLHVSSAVTRIKAQMLRDQMFEQLMAEKMEADQAREMERLKTNFMSTATHEIRTPLTSIRGYSEIIQGDLKRKNYGQVGKYFDIIQKNIDRLQHLTDDLLDLQRIESGRMVLDVKEARLNSVIKQVKVEMQPLLAEKQQHLIINNHSHVDTVMIDEMRIIQVLVNYINNASKFSEEGAVIELGVADTPNGLRVYVRDEGVGLKPVDIEKLFKPFPDISAEHVRRGTGLGLSICKGIIELHGGFVQAESEGRGKGSIFSFEIPVTS